MTGCAERCLVRDDWLGDILGRPAYRLDSLTGPLATAVAGLAPGAFVCTKADCRDIPSVHALELLGFRLVDTNVVLEKPRDATPPAESLGVRFARPEDEGAVARIAGGGFSLTRFHLDPLLADSADIIKESWARNFFRGRRGDHMVVAVADGEVAGFNQLLLGADGTLTIDLIAVDARFRRRGLGAAMIRFAETHLPTATIVRVGTQIANTASLRLYESLGFRVARSQYVFHYHVPQR